MIRSPILILQVDPLRSSRAVVKGARTGTAISLGRYLDAQVLAFKRPGSTEVIVPDHDTAWSPATFSWSWAQSRPSRRWPVDPAARQVRELLCCNVAMAVKPQVAEAPA
jgi:hypothetical protein